MLNESDHRNRTVALFFSLLGICLSLGCSHYVRSEIAVARSIQAVDLPEPEIVPARDLDARRDQLRTVSIYLVQESQRGDEIRELERSFLRAGYQIQAAQALTPQRVAELGGLQAVVARRPSDAAVLVYKLESTDVTRAVVSAEPVFAHGRSLANLADASAEDIEKAVGRTGAMGAVVAEANQRISDQGLLDVSTARAAFLDAKILDGRTQEALMFYRAYTFVSPEALELGDSREKIPVGTYRYDTSEGAFLPYSAVKAAPEPTYGDLRVQQRFEDADLALRDAHLELVKQACDDLVRAFQTPDALRY